MFTPFAFNTVHPVKLYNKLLDMNIHPAMCHWILHFLINRQQRVKVGDKLYGPLSLYIGAPHGCVLSPLLFSLYTNDLKSQCSSVKFFKNADHITIIRLISENGDLHYCHEVDNTVQWCTDNNLQMNTSTTMETTNNFRHKQKPKSRAISTPNQ